MDYSNFILLLARQRSGTNPLRSVLDTHGEIFCVPEVFHDRPTPDWDLEVDTNYVNFLERRMGDDVRGLLALPDHGALFLDFLEYVRCFSDRRYVLIDVKYNSTHHVAKYWRFVTEEPFLFSLVRDNGIRVLNLTRRNYLRYYLSETKAHLTRRWEAFDERVVGDRPWYVKKYAGRAAPEDPRIRIDIDDMLKVLELCRSESEVVARSFAGYDRYLELDYEDMFREMGAPIAFDALDRITGWLGLDPAVTERRPQYKKQSALALEDTIENFDEVADALRGTPMEYCLADEPVYRKQAESTPR